MKRILLCSLFAMALAAGCSAPQERHMFYLHGQIVEGSDGRPDHPRYGMYNYPGIVKALEERGFTVHSEIREYNTDGPVWASKIAARVRQLLDDGVPPERITVLGNSKGGGIAVAACDILGNDRLSFVFTGTCVNWIQDWPELQLKGRVLSIVEESDTVAGSCKASFGNSRIEPLFREIVIRTGKGHGAFYEPDPAWLEPAVRWAMGQQP